jgi:steroid delta-isomerase-like uncharacterized protein
MSEQENLRVNREAFAAWNAHDVDRFIALLDAEFVWESDTLPEPLRGREAAAQAMQMYVRAFPDLHFDIEQEIASGDDVVVRWRVVGTHQGEFMGIAPTNARITTNGCNVLRYKNGKQVHAWSYWDLAHVLQAMGVLPQFGA